MASLKQIQAALLTGRKTVSELVETYLAQIEKTAHLNIYVEVYSDEAREMARQLDEKLQEDRSGLGNLFGAVISHKDVICLEGHRVSAASKMLKNFTSPYTATALQRLIDEDAIVIGRVNCDEFGMGSTNEFSKYGPTKNGIDPNRIPGGSSGGSAVAVQMDTCLISLGSDTGGSVRQPAAFCGITGFKPGYGCISRHGLIAYASSFDQIGILAKNVEDTAFFYSLMAGPDEYDGTVVAKTGQTVQKKSPIKLATLANTFDRIDPQILKASQHWLTQRKKEGLVINDMAFDWLDALIPVYYILTTAEASSNLSRYDGVRYGHRSPQVTDLESLYRNSRTEGFGAEVKRRILMGTFVLSEGYFDAYFQKAQKLRMRIKSSIQSIFAECDFIIMPVTTDVAWEVGAQKQDPVQTYLSDIFTVLASITGMPAISIPLGKKDNGLPYGIQIMANEGHEMELLQFCQGLTLPESGS